MKKAVCLAIVACLFLVVPAMAERFYAEVIPVTIMGVPCQVVKTVQKGGPLNGFFGTTRVHIATYELAKDGYPAKISEYGSSSDGLGKELPKALIYGGSYISGQAVRRPDQTINKTTVTGTSAAGSTVGTTTAGASAGVINNNTNLQAQGQAQGQLQGQFQNQKQDQFQKQDQSLF